ncbi:MAG: metal ABC transporter permease [Ruminococcus sp.]|nr:metal ABC transporter permease [Ruminococcus sp.]
MSETLETLKNYLEFPAVRYAIIVGLLISLCSSLLGVTLVMKRFSFIGDGLSHVAFGAMAIATVLNVTDNMLVIMPVTVVAAVLLLRTGQNTKIKGDAAVAMISVGALALGYLMMNLAPKNGRASANLSADVCSTLFGSTSILTLSQKDVITCIIMSAIVVAVFFFFYTKIFAVTFDESFAKATGIRSDLYNLLIAVVIAVIIVFAMNFVGSLLISALIIFPALSAMRVFKSFKSVIACSVVISLFCAAVGLLLAILEGTPVGSTIVAADIAVFFIFNIISFVTRRGEK